MSIIIVVSWYSIYVLYSIFTDNNIVFTNSIHQPQSDDDDDDELPLFRIGFLVGLRVGFRVGFIVGLLSGVHHSLLLDGDGVGFGVGLLSGVHHCLLLVGIFVGLGVGLGGGGGFGVGDHHSPPPLSPPSHLSK